MGMDKTNNKILEALNSIEKKEEGEGQEIMNEEKREQITNFDQDAPEDLQEEAKEISYKLSELIKKYKLSDEEESKFLLEYISEQVGEMHR